MMNQPGQDARTLSPAELHELVGRAEKRAALAVDAARAEGDRADQLALQLRRARRIPLRTDDRLGRLALWLVLVMLVLQLATLAVAGGLL